MRGFGGCFGSLMQCLVAASGVGLIMFETGAYIDQFLPQAQPCLRQILQLLFIILLLLLDMRQGIAKALCGADLLIGGFGQGGGNGFAQFAQPQDGNHHKTGDRHSRNGGESDYPILHNSTPVTGLGNVLLPRL